MKHVCVSMSGACITNTRTEIKVGHDFDAETGALYNVAH